MTTADRPNRDWPIRDWPIRGWQGITVNGKWVKGRGNRETHKSYKHRMSMITRRYWPRRLSKVLMIVCIFLYVCAHLTSSGPWNEEASNNWPVAKVAISLAETYGSAKNNQQANSRQITGESSISYARPKASIEISEQTEKYEQKDDEINNRKQEIDTLIESRGERSQFGEKINENRDNPPESKKPQSKRDKKDNKRMAEAPLSGMMTAREAISCNEKSSEPRTTQRGDYWVLYNYVPMSIRVKCWESVTYTTHADYTFLDNLVPLLERWRAPISIALHAPGTDFQATLNSIKYARNCTSLLVPQFVTFHIYFSRKHIPELVPRSETIVSDTYNCSLDPPWANVVPAKMYKNEKKLLYPMNVGRNIAREFATTHYVLASDIELYPSLNLPSEFLGMIARADQSVLLKPKPKVFVLSVFEIDEKSTPPSNKTLLIEMLKNGSAIPFHKEVCPECHNVPASRVWQETPQSDALRVFHVGKRIRKFARWEPIFIGTNDDPMYDERLSWDGQEDKMPQGYVLCVLDYNFLILDNAFLVHRPGIKKHLRGDAEMIKTKMLINETILPELKILYGTRRGCDV